jgi:aspartate 1-decarboxylase
VQVGDPVIVLAYAWVAEEQLPDFRARLVFVDEGNRILRVQVVPISPSR